MEKIAMGAMVSKFLKSSTLGSAFYSIMHVIGLDIKYASVLGYLMILDIITGIFKSKKLGLEIRTDKFKDGLITRLMIFIGISAVAVATEEFPKIKERLGDEPVQMAVYWAFAYELLSIGGNIVSAFIKKDIDGTKYLVSKLSALFDKSSKDA